MFEHGSLKMGALADLPAGSQVVVHESNEKSCFVRSRIAATRSDVEVIAFADADGNRTIEGIPVIRFDQIGEFPNAIAVTNQTNWVQTFWPFATAGFPLLFVLPVFDPRHSKRNCIVIDEWKTIFVPIYKCAYSSFTEIFRSSIPRFANTQSGTSLNSFIDLRDEEYADFFKFAVVRNPIARALACFNDKYGRLEGHTNALTWKRPLLQLLNRQSIDFKEWLDFVATVPDSHSDLHWRSQYSSIFTESGKCLVNQVYRLEHIEDHFHEIKARTGMSGDLQHLNRSPKKVTNAFDVDRSLIHQRYHHDFSTFGYDLE